MGLGLGLGLVALSKTNFQTCDMPIRSADCIVLCLSDTGHVVCYMEDESGPGLQISSKAINLLKGFFVFHRNIRSYFFHHMQQRYYYID